MHWIHKPDGGVVGGEEGGQGGAGLLPAGPGQRHQAVQRRRGKHILQFDSQVEGVEGGDKEIGFFLLVSFLPDSSIKIFSNSVARISVKT